MDNEKRAIELIEMASEMSERYYKKPIVCTYSGGKDSDVLVELFLRSGVEFEVRECPFENGIIQAQKNGCGTFVAVAPTLLSSDYKQPPLVIEKRKEQDNGKN